jgi:hypothetical protein
MGKMSPVHPAEIQLANTGPLCQFTKKRLLVIMDLKGPVTCHQVWCD